MPDMHTAIPCTGSTADQAVSTVHVQLDAAKHLTRPMTFVSDIDTFFITLTEITGFHLTLTSQIKTPSYSKYCTLSLH